MSPDTIGEALLWTAGHLERAGIEEVRLESRLLVAQALGKSPEYVFSHPERVLDDAAQERLNQVVARRARHEPMAYITGQREFWSLPFTVAPSTLIPRPDSETLVDAVLNARPDADGTLRILDLGTGSGCLLLALLHERRNWTGVGLDRSAAALEVAAANAQSLELAQVSEFVCHDWAEKPLVELGLGDFDLVIANPPYIAESDRQNLAPDVIDFEPLDALFAGADGLDAFRFIVPQAVAVLVPGGGLFLEVGYDQSDRVAAILAAHGYDGIGERRDVSGIARCVFAGIEKQ